MGPMPSPAVREGGRRRGFAWYTAAALVLVALPVRELIRETTRPRAPETPLDISFAPLVAALPPDVAIGWAGDGSTAHDVFTARARLQYAVAPRVVGRGSERAETVVAWAPDEERMARLLRERGLSIGARFEGGYALCRPLP